MTLSTAEQLAVFRRRKVKLQTQNRETFFFYPTPEDPEPLPTDEICDFLTIEVNPEGADCNYRLTIANVVLDSNNLAGLEDVLCCWANSEYYFAP